MAGTTAQPGDRFNRWTLIEYAGGRKWLAQCDCGKQSVVTLDNMRSGKSRQCKSCSLRQVRRSNPDRTNQMITTGAIKRLPALSDRQLEQLLNAVVAERDGREFS